MKFWPVIIFLLISSVRLSKMVEIKGSFLYKGKEVTYVNLSENVDICTDDPHVSFLDQKNLIFVDAFLKRNLELVENSVPILCTSEEKLIFYSSNFTIWRLGHFLKVNILSTGNYFFFKFSLILFLNIEKKL